MADIFPYPVERASLSNRLKVLMIRMPAEGLVTYWSIVRTGSRDEVEPGVTGFAHFFEHMMFRGTDKYPARQYNSIIASIGASENAFTSDDLTAFHVSFTRDDLPKVIEIESDRFKHLNYAEPEFKTEAGAVYGEFRKGRTSPFFVLHEAVHNLAFDRHTYKHTTIGFEEDIKRMPDQFQYSRTFFQRFYRPDNTVLLVAGDFDPEATLQLIRQHYSDWQPGYRAPEIPPEPEQTSQRRVEVPFDGQTLPILAINFKGEPFRPHDPVMVAATLIEELAFGETSDLYRKLLLKEQRLQMLTADFGLNRDPGLWSVMAMVKRPEDLPAVEGEIWDCLKGLRGRGVEAARLEAVRARVRNGFLSYLTSPDRVAGKLARFIALTGDVTAVEDYLAALSKVTPDQILQAANRYLLPERSTVAILHSKDEAIAPAATAASAPILLPVANDPNVVVKLWFRVGSQDDPKGKEGLAALTASLLTEGGTRDHPYSEVLEQLYPLAASYQDSVDKEMTVISGVVYRDAAPRFVQILAETLLQPGFREEDFQRLKSRTLATLEKTLRYSSDEELGKAVLYERVLAGTPCQHLSLGTVASLKSMTLDDVRQFYASHFTRENVTLALSGAYDQELEKTLQASLARLPSGQPAPVAAPACPPIAGRQVVLVKKPGPSTAISFGCPIDLHRGSREFYALWLANSWLGEHRNSSGRLYQFIREARGMNYGDYSYIEAFPNGGRRSMPPTGVGRRQQLFEVWIRPVPEGRAVFALRAALREVDNLSRHGLTRDQFEAHRAFLKKYCLQFATDTEARLGYAVDDRFYGIEGHLATFRRLMDELTLEEVNAAIRKHLQVERLVIAMVAADTDSLKRS
ncbi:MAG TPA: pitrilysin family protein, partial [Dongiaceae bacterium]|nr:pitrilysin family protein [Dongiaceae bacterium]